MKKIILFVLIYQISFFYYAETMAGELNVTAGKLTDNSSFKKAYLIAPNHAKAQNVDYAFFI